VFAAPTAFGQQAGIAQSQAQPGAAQSPPGQAHTIVVKIVDKSPTEFEFEPAQITVEHGDTVRFVQTGYTPHNVEFKSVPAGADLGKQQVGPYLSKKDQTYDVVIDGRFPQGLYGYVCTPHSVLGMKGSITVADAPSTKSQ
jgi:plastocyanin